MPMVNIRIVPDGVTREQKAALIRGATELMSEVLGKSPAATTVIIEEVPADNWGIGGETLTARREKAKKA